MEKEIISFKDIYKKSVGLFDDPKIVKAYETNTIQFSKLMYTYLQNAISLFNNPVEIALMLSSCTEPKGTMEIFKGDGINNVFTLDEGFILKDNSDYLFIENGKMVKGILNKEERTVTFPTVLAEGEEYSIEQYYIGEFICDFSSWGIKDNLKRTILSQIKDILARLLVCSWGEETRNFLLDIQNIMTDTDFKLHPASGALTSKINLTKQLTTEISQLKNKLSWNIKIATV